MLKITTHTLVKNEDQWIWFALKAWEPYATSMLVYDDDSKDSTQNIISSVGSNKIKYKKIKIRNSIEMTQIRQEMKEITKTEWFLVLDGDEVWSQSTILKFLTYLESVDSNINMVALRTRNCVGDIYHYLSEDLGKYEILGMRGHFNIRAYRNNPRFSWKGEYPLEYYADENGSDLLKSKNSLGFVDDFYWHLTHLSRSSNKDSVKGWRKIKYDLGIEIKDLNTYPEVFNLPRPSLVPDPWKHMTIKQTIISLALTPLRFIKMKGRLL